ncbi:hypothetical protein [Aquamicrobium soli]|uniref:Uncharacterized protein n=1 Tax=Aquamicrobium soli TaxID=1811518 RepID=A0ABV7KAN9_9HYPH
MSTLQKIREDAGRKGFSVTRIDAGHFVITTKNGDGVVRATPATLEEVEAFLESEGK